MTQKTTVVAARLRKEFIEAMDYKPSHEDTIDFLESLIHSLQEYCDNPIFLGVVE